MQQNLRFLLELASPRIGITTRVTTRYTCTCKQTRTLSTRLHPAKSLLAKEKSFEKDSRFSLSLSLPPPFSRRFSALFGRIWENGDRSCIINELRSFEMQSQSVTNCKWKIFRCSQYPLARRYVSACDT